MKRLIPEFPSIPWRGALPRFRPTTDWRPRALQEDEQSQWHTSLRHRALREHQGRKILGCARPVGSPLGSGLRCWSSLQGSRPSLRRACPTFWPVFRAKSIGRWWERPGMKKFLCRPGKNAMLFFAFVEIDDTHQQPIRYQSKLF